MIERAGGVGRRNGRFNDSGFERTSGDVLSLPRYDDPQENGDFDTVRQYLNEIGQIPILPGNEQRRLARDVLKGELALVGLKLLEESGLPSKPLRERTQEVPHRDKVKILLDNIPKSQIQDVEVKRNPEYDKEDKRGKKRNIHYIFDRYRGRFKHSLDDLREKKSRSSRERTLRELVERLVANVDQATRSHEELVTTNLRLVASVAKKKKLRRGHDILDLIQDGSIGLRKAAAQFDYGLGYEFSTYATWWIRQAISRGFMDTSRTIRVPLHAQEAVLEFKKHKRQLTQDLGREPTEEELKELANGHLKIDRDTLFSALKVDDICSLDMQLGEDENQTLADFIPDDGETVDEQSARSELQRAVREAVDRLTKRERKVLALRYGMTDGRTRTLEEVGGEFQVTRERIRQIEAQALRKLRHPRNGSARLRQFLDADPRAAKTTGAKELAHEIRKR